ncbi:MAG: MotA/TolQ/ExbB proton channel family protein [Nevskiaceae bacterium]
MLDFLLAPFEAVGGLVEMGGVAVEWIFIASILMWAITFERYYYFRHRLAPQATSLLAEWEARKDHDSWTARQIRRGMISRLNVAMTANLGILKVLVPMCPLLGLLGTVTGMLEVFDAMAARGSADARTMASGVSQAMVCTMTGLAVSITGIYPVFYFSQKAKYETELLADKFSY